MSTVFETVHTMTDYYDGPRRGVADFRGRPHVYESLFSDSDGNFTDSFRLAPISNEVFQLALEAWGIWLRWEAAFKRGEVDHSTHPALPADSLRHAELERLLESKLTADASDSVLATAEFRTVDSTIQVRWSVLQAVE